ncbi:MAG: flagellar assembly protein FliW [Syntrophomonas sp.]
MNIQTALLGELEIDENEIITFRDGLPGFEKERQFIIIPMDENGGPFYYLQSATSPNLCLVIADPFTFFPGYEIEIADPDLQKIGVEQGNHNIAIYVILTIPEDFKLTTANLLAPLVINSDNRQAMQYIATKTGYSTRHLVFKPQKPTAASAAGEGR